MRLRTRLFLMKKYLVIILWSMVVSGASIAQEAVSATSETDLSSCPDGMAKIENRFCIDRYEFPNQKDHIPQGGVTWLEAVALCKKQGKRLCSSQEWERACSGSSGKKYPYGNDYDRTRCVSGRKHTRGSAPSGSNEDCKSEEGVYDLSGNLWEWVGTEEKQASLAGGGWMTGESGSRCDSRAWTGVPKSTNFTYGFRCCTSLKKAQEQE